MRSAWCLSTAAIRIDALVITMAMIEGQLDRAGGDEIVVSARTAVIWRDANRHHHGHRRDDAGLGGRRHGGCAGAIGEVGTAVIATPAPQSSSIRPGISARSARYLSTAAIRYGEHADTMATLETILDKAGGNEMGASARSAMRVSTAVTRSDEIATTMATTERQLDRASGDDMGASA